VQYACANYVARLEAAGACASMAAVGNPYDNAKAESFFKTLKREEVYLQDDRTYADTEANIGHFVDDVYNTKRLHSILGYRPPAEFEAIFARKAAELTLAGVRARRPRQPALGLRGPRRYSNLVRQSLYHSASQAGLRLEYRPGDASGPPWHV